MFQASCKRIFFQDEHLPRGTLEALSREVRPYSHYPSTFGLSAPRSPDLGQWAHYHHLTCSIYSSIQLRHTLQKDCQQQCLRFSKYRLLPLRKKRKPRKLGQLGSFCVRFIQNELLTSFIYFPFIYINVVKLVSTSCDRVFGQSRGTLVSRSIYQSI